MLDSGQVWFTSVYHVNDPSEERFGIEVKKILQDLCSKTNLTGAIAMPFLSV